MELKDILEMADKTREEPIKKKELKVVHTVDFWKNLRSEGGVCYADWTDRELETHVNGYIGTKCGVRCYVQQPYVL